MKKVEIKLLFGGKDMPAHYEPVQAELVGTQWAVHKDFDGKNWVITHVKSGKRVESFRTSKMAKLLLQEPEFFDEIDDTNPEHLAKLAAATKRFRDKNGWK